MCKPTLAQGVPGLSLLSERHVEGAAAQGLELSSQTLRLLKSATAMASAAVTAASATAALVPFRMGLGCLPATGASRNFLIQWPFVLPYLMAMTSLATAVAL